MGERQKNITVEEGYDVRKYEVGTVLVFKRYIDSFHGGFKVDDKVVVTTHNGGGMGIDAKRISDSLIDMVWPDEVEICPDQTVPKGFDLSSPKDFLEVLSIHHPESPAL